MACDFVSCDRYVVNAALIDLRQKFAKRNIAYLRSLSRLLEQHHQRQHEQSYDCPKRDVPEVRVHVEPMREALASGTIPRNVPLWE